MYLVYITTIDFDSKCVTEFVVRESEVACFLVISTVKSCCCIAEVGALEQELENFETIVPGAKTGHAVNRYALEIQLTLKGVT